MTNGVYEYLSDVITCKGAAWMVLIDPDKLKDERLTCFIDLCSKAGVDGLLIGGSLITNGDLADTLRLVKSVTSLPSVLFPGSVSQVIPDADAILYLSLVSGRNAEHLIGKHVLAAPLIKKYGIETIPTAYMLIESGTKTTVEYISGSSPLPRNKPEIAAATALASQYLGMKMIYLEAGSGAQLTVPDEMVRAVSGAVDIPVIVGGGIRSAENAASKVQNGAKVIVTGNFFEDEDNWKLLGEFSEAVHFKKK